jgi:hypothetical protein
MTYELGLSVVAQCNGSGAVQFLLQDGHGSTRIVANDLSGNPTVSQYIAAIYDYDAFGNALNFNAATAVTPWLFGGDAIYDPASGQYFNGDGIRTRTAGRPYFNQMDSFGFGDSSDPVTLNAELYGDGDPVDNNDPSGHYASGSSYSVSYGLVGGDDGDKNTLFGGTALDTIASGAGAMLVGVGGLISTEALAPVFGAIAAFNGIMGGITNETSAASDVSGVGSFAVGFASSFSASILSDVGAPCWVASGVGGAILSVGNDYLSNPNTFNFTEALKDVATGALGGILQGGYCFVAGTPVLLGDRQTRAAIEQICVGDRVATDGGVANSVDGNTKAADPNATAVDPKTWRKVRIIAGDWEIEALRPVGWLDTHNVAVKGSVSLGAVIGLIEMGGPQGLVGMVESIEPCPVIQTGRGRVVLTAVSHRSDSVFDLTLKDGLGRQETVGVTGQHRYYCQTTGWTRVQELRLGHVLRGDHGDLPVVGLANRDGTHRVYNMAVEADHVYYTGELLALAHNSCGDDVNGNSFKSSRTTYLYALFDKVEGFLKWGISLDPESRYTKSFMNGKTMEILESGSREEMYNLEKILASAFGGPLNKEPWSSSQL